MQIATDSEGRANRRVFGWKRERVQHMVPDQRIYRHIVDVLLAEHESRGIPNADDYPTKLLACIWGLYAYIHRLARVVTLLADKGISFEANPTVRVILEHTIVLHWIVERGDDGVDALIANQTKQMKRWMNNTKGTGLEVPPALATELLGSFVGIDESKALDTFKRICDQVDAQSLYTVYGVESLFVHPTTTTSNTYVGDTGLSITPTGEHSSNIALVAHCLIWAERDFDRLTPGQPRAVELERLAKSINARPTLPPYHAVTSRPKPNNRKSRRQRRNK
jgi:hypothetical protein